MSSSRRFFLGSLAATAGSVLMRRRAIARSPAPEKLRVGVMGLARGLDLAKTFAVAADAEISYLCDVDKNRLAKAHREIGKLQARPVQVVGDFRRILDDASVDALVIAAPDHWHAVAAILACAAGKHVYVEKPATHNSREGELLVAAARKHKRVVQHGTQRRTMPAIVDAIGQLHRGKIGVVRYARCWYHTPRPSIGRGRKTPVPAELDYALWQGPAPARPYRNNVVHYHWHWFWHWGTAELGNNGVHTIDLARWGLQVDYPKSVTTAGGRFRFDDDQETPDTLTVAFDFGDKAINWECRNWPRTRQEGAASGIIFHGTDGNLVIGDDESCRFYDPVGKEFASRTGPLTHDPHVRDFIDCVRSSGRPAADIEEGVKSTLLCHLGNIAYRVGRTVRLNDISRRIASDADAEALWSREYQPGWDPS